MSPSDENKKNQGTISHYFRAAQQQPPTSRKRPQPSTSEPQDSPSTEKRPKPSPSSSRQQRLKVTLTKGDLFTLPPARNALLIHACNTQGSWGAGIAALFARNFPGAYWIYREHCSKAKNEGRGLVGRCLVIPPPPALTSSSGEGGGGGKGRKDRRQFVGCLFTSEGFGRRKASPEEILAATETAMGELLGWVGEWNRGCVEELKSARRKDGEGAGKAKSVARRGEAAAGKDTDDDDKVEEEGEEEYDDAHDDEIEDRRIHTIHMCKINAGLFNVPWEDTLAVLEKIPLPLSISPSSSHSSSTEEGGEENRKGGEKGEESGKRIVISRVEVISP